MNPTPRKPQRPSPRRRALAACGSASAQDDEPHAQEAAASQSPAAGDSGDAPAETQGEEQSLAAKLLFNGPSHTDTAAPGAWGESGCDAQKQARIIVVRGTEEPAGQSLMSPLASRIAAELGDHAQVSDLRIAAELGDHAQVSDLDYPASWESGSEAAGVNRLIAVLNAFPEAEPTPSDLYSPERAFRLDGDATVHVGNAAAYRIRWSSELTDALHELACTGAIELQWLSTWQPYTALLESGSEAAGVNRLIAVLNAQSAQCPAMRTVLLG